MKQGKLNKKLAFNKETIRDLVGAQLRNVAGGLTQGCPPSFFACPTDLPSVCPDKCPLTPGACGGGNTGGGGGSGEETCVMCPMTGKICPEH
jgi:hypothetical protein